MTVFHLSAECYPVAKVGGLGDVVGALPKYLCKAGVDAKVVLPYYDRKFVQENKFKQVFSGKVQSGDKHYDFTVLKEKSNVLGFELYLIHIAGLLDRPEIYSYPDETEQFTTFQIAFLDWINQSRNLPDILHCHDHHTGLIPFLISHSSRYSRLKNIPSICTVHNGQYQGWFGWDKIGLLNEFDLSKAGLLDWNKCINPLATAIKCCWKFTTVSLSYLEELAVSSNGLEHLFQAERAKGTGIINGIDNDVWNPATDKYLNTQFSIEKNTAGKAANKKQLCAKMGLDSELPLIAFIGRLVGEKGADLLPELVKNLLTTKGNKASILILGSGEKAIENELTQIKQLAGKDFGLYIGYNEELSHQIYASADYLLMPSRVEPCGLNQLYSLRYGTLPIVRNTGGLKDTVVDIEEDGGYGIKFKEATVTDISEAVKRAIEIYPEKRKMSALRKRMMSLDYSWDRSAAEYIALYKSLI